MTQKQCATLRDPKMCPQAKFGIPAIQNAMLEVFILARPDDTRISRFELWVASDITLVPFNSRAPVVTDFVVKNRKKPNC